MANRDASDAIAVHPVTVVSGPLRVVRTIDIRDEGLAVTHRISTRGSADVRFLVIDPLPSNLEHGDVGFHPDHAPAAGRVEPQYAVMSDVARPDSERVFTYGLCPAPPLRPEAVKRLQDQSRPVIDIAEPVESGTVEQAELEQAAMVRSAAEAETSSSNAVARLKSLLGLGE